MQLVAYPRAVPRRPARQRTRLDPLRTDFTLGTLLSGVLSEATGDRLIVTYLSQVLFLGGDTRARALSVLVSNRVLKKS